MQPNEVVDDLDALVHFVFDDSGLGSDPEGEIGLILLSNQEVMAVKDFIDLLESIVDDLGDAQISTYFHDSRWSSLEVKARATHDSLAPDFLASGDS